MSEFYFPAFDHFDLDDREQTLAEYFMRLQGIASKARDEFDYTASTSQELRNIRETIQAEFTAMAQQALEAPSDSNPAHFIYTPGLGTAEVREQSALLRAETSAGSLMLMVDDVVQRLRHSVLDSNGKHPYPSEFTLGMSVSGICTSTLIWAAGNAYRHAKDWEGLVDDKYCIVKTHRQYRDSKRTLEILLPSIGLDPVLESRTCVASLLALSGSSSDSSTFDEFWDKSIRSIGRDFAFRYCPSGISSFQKVQEAVANTTEVLYSDNEALFRTPEGSGIG